MVMHCDRFTPLRTVLCRSVWSFLGARFLDSEEGAKVVHHIYICSYVLSESLRPDLPRTNRPVSAMENFSLGKQ